MRYRPDWKTLLGGFLLLNSLPTSAQSPNLTSPLDGRNLGIVLDHPDVKNVTVKRDITYLSDANGTLKLDVYLPPRVKLTDRLPTIVFLNAIGEDSAERKVKSWLTYQTWPTLMAAQGYVGISMETDGTRIQESLRGVFDFLVRQGAQYQVDAERIGVYAASANVTQASRYLMSADAHKGIKAAVLYYGQVPQAPFRKDLPVLFVVAEGDVPRVGYGTLWGDVLKNNAPWTVLMASNLPHAFDTFSNNDNARRVIRQTISFWQDHLEPVPPFADPQPIARQILEARYGQQAERTAELLKTWMTQHPDDPVGLAMYAASLRDFKRYDEAEILYRKLLTLEPNHLDALLGMALLAHLKNQPAEAETYLAKARSVRGETRSVYANLAFRLLVAGKFRECVPYYEKATQIEPYGADFYNLACAYALANEKEKALGALERAAKLGYGSRQQYDSDPDLVSLRSEERYQKLFSQPN